MDDRRGLRLVSSRVSSRVEDDPLAEVASAASGGDRRAIRSLLLAIGPSLLRVVRGVLGANHLDVDDVAQESAFAVVEALPTHRGECTVLHFACRVAVLTAMNTRRRNATLKRHATREDLETHALPSDAPAPDAQLIARARAQVVRDLLDTLPLEQAEVLALHCVLGYTVREISVASVVPVETVRSRLRLAKHSLRDRILDDPRLAKIVGEPE